MMRINEEKSSHDGWHVLFHEGRADFLEGIEDGGGAFHYYKGREDNLKCVDYNSGIVYFYCVKKVGWITEVPLWRQEFDWRRMWVEEDYALGEHSYEVEK